MNKLGKLFTGWEPKKNIITPIIVNITTACIIFFAAVIFKDRIFKWFGIKQEIASYPIYCIMEPYNEVGKEVIVDLFIVNLEDETYTITELKNITDTQAAAKDVNLSPIVEIKLKKRISGEIIMIIEDEIFNDDKGVVKIDSLNSGHWKIAINNLEGRAILKFKIITSVRRPNISRNAKATVPLEIIYPGR